MHGHRWMHRKCLECGLCVSRDTVYYLLQILDPRGIRLRKKGRLKRRQYFAKGPNYLWHLDSYDKLKPFGLCISGCIDGFSRQLIWLNVYHTSSNPRVNNNQTKQGKRNNKTQSITQGQEPNGFWLRWVSMIGLAPNPDPACMYAVNLVKK